MRLKLFSLTSTILLSGLLGCSTAHNAQAHDLTLSKKKGVQLTLISANGNITPSTEFTLSQRARYKIWVELNVRTASGDLERVKISSEFYGKLNILDDQNNVFEVIDINEKRHNAATNDIGTDIIVLSPGFRNKQLYLADGGLFMPPECSGRKCEIIIIIEKFSFSKF